MQNQLERRSNRIQSHEQLLEHTVEQMQKLRGELAMQQAEAAALKQKEEERQQQASQAEQLYRQQQALVEEQHKQLQHLRPNYRRRRRSRKRHKQAVFANMQEQARNHNTLQRLEHELSGSGRSRERWKKSWLSWSRLWRSKNNMVWN